MADKKTTADDVIKALEKRTDLLREVKERLSPEPRTVWALTLVEHEFGQRDEGSILFIRRTDAIDYKNERTGRGAPGQFFTYDGPDSVQVTPEVYQRIQEAGGRLRGPSWVRSVMTQSQPITAALWEKKS
jgi:hypothetical protein